MTSIYLPLDRSNLRLHPVMTRKFKIPTPPVQNAFSTICSVVASSDPGCAWIAPPRFGKTWTAEYCQVMLAKTFPEVPIVFFSGDHHDRRSRNMFFEALYAETVSPICGKPANYGKSTQDFQRLLANNWWLSAREKGSHQVVFIGDEMQSLTMEAYSWLIVMSNALHRKGISLTCILFAQPDLLHLKSSFNVANRFDIIGRFMTRVHAFRGLNSALELRDVMAAYDDASELEYPESSGICFTEFFLPIAYKDGWRLSTCANDCWNQFQLIAEGELKSSAKLARLTIGMEWVAGAIKNILSRSSDYDQPRFSLKPNDWQRAIRSTPFAESLATIYELSDRDTAL
jgi:hypothetical protein